MTGSGDARVPKAANKSDARRFGIYHFQVQEKCFKLKVCVIIYDPYLVVRPVVLDEALYMQQRLESRSADSMTLCEIINF